MKRGPTDGRWQLTFDWSGKPVSDAMLNSETQTGVATIEPEQQPSGVYAVAETPPPLPGEFREAPQRKRSVSPRAGRRVTSSLPVPRPLPDSILAGHFGHDEAGKPIHPKPEEVRAITENHAYKLMNVLVDRHAAHGDERDRLDADYEKRIAAYVEDFGTRAGERLRAHVCKLASESIPTPSRGR